MMELFLNDEWSARVGLTLLHFLWQGAAVAGLLWIALRLAGRSKPEVRYALSCTAMLLLLACPIGTFCMVDASTLEQIVQKKPPVEAADPWVSWDGLSERQPTPMNPDGMEERIRRWPKSEGIVQADRAELDAMAWAENQNQPERSPKADPPGKTRDAGADRWMVSISDALSPVLPWLTAGWIAGVVGLCIWNVGGLWTLLRWRRGGTPLERGQWRGALSNLTSQMGFRADVALRQSARIISPMVIGVFKPAILIPVSLATGLSPDQIQAILAHELAHIQRHDYLVNLLQAIVETVLFYHPCVWWVSRQIRREREICCDARAVETLGNRHNYAESLVSVFDRMDEERSSRSLRVALRLTNRLAPRGDHSLLVRIRHLLGSRTSPTNRFLTATISAILLTSLSVGILVSCQSNMTDEQRRAYELRKLENQSLKLLEYGVAKGFVIINRCNGTPERIVIPPTIEGEPVKAIGTSAFSSKTSLREVTIPNSVVSIEGHAFSGTALESVRFGAPLMGTSAFSYCWKLQNVTLAEGVASLPQGTFLECVSLEQINIPDSVTWIGENAFQGCVKLKSITIGRGVKTIDRWAFLSCTGLEEVKLLNPDTSIRTNAFSNCTSLKQITLADGKKIKPPYIRLSDEGILKDLQSEKREIRLGAAWDARRKRGPLSSPMINTLFAAIDIEEDTGMQQVFFFPLRGRAIPKADADAVFKRLLAYVADDRPSIWVNACGALYGKNAPLWRDRLTEMMPELPAKVKLRLGLKTSQFGDQIRSGKRDKAVYEFLLSIINNPAAIVYDGSSTVFDKACRLIARYGDTRAVPDLVRALVRLQEAGKCEQSHIVQGYPLRAINTLTGKNYGGFGATWNGMSTQQCDAVSWDSVIAELERDYLPERKTTSRLSVVTRDFASIYQHRKPETLLPEIKKRADELGLTVIFLKKITPDSQFTTLRCESENPPTKEQINEIRNWSFKGHGGHRVQFFRPVFDKLMTSANPKDRSSQGVAKHPTTVFQREVIYQFPVPKGMGKPNGTFEIMYDFGNHRGVKRKTVHVTDGQARLRLPVNARVKMYNSRTWNIPGYVPDMERKGGIARRKIGRAKILRGRVASFMVTDRKDPVLVSINLRPAGVLRGRIFTADGKRADQTILNTQSLSVGYASQHLYGLRFTIDPAKGEYIVQGIPLGMPIYATIGNLGNTPRKSTEKITLDKDNPSASVDIHLPAPKPKTAAERRQEVLKRLKELGEGLKQFQKPTPQKFPPLPIAPRFVEQYWLKKGQSPAAALKALRAGGVGGDGRPTVMFDKRGKKHPVKNQGEVLDLFDKGYQPLSTSEIVTCHYLRHQRTALQQLAKAKLSRISYLHSLKVDRAFVELLPASLWSKLNFYCDGKNILTASDNDKRLLDTLKPKKITPYASGRQGVEIEWPREYSPDAVWNMCIEPLGTGDFNGDGVEDMLISIYQGDGRLFAVGPILLTRYSKDGLLEIAAVGEFPSQHETKRYQIAVHHLCQEEGCVACSNYLMAVRDKTTGRSFHAIGKTINLRRSLSFKGYECSHKGKTYRLVLQGAKPRMTVTDAPKKPVTNPPKVSPHHGGANRRRGRSSRS